MCIRDRASILSGLRLGQLRGWDAWTMDVKSAFMTAKLPSHMKVVVRPPQIWVDLGVVEPGTLWVAHRAIYGLRQSPRVWGTERDEKLRAARWAHDGGHWRLQQCQSESQVWKLIREVRAPTRSGDRKAEAERGHSGGKAKATEEVCGLIFVYVDDFLLSMPKGRLEKLSKNTCRASGR